MGRALGIAARPLELEELLEMICGDPLDGSSVFTSDEERRAAYFANRAELSAMLGFPGNRSASFWRYEAEIPEPEDKDERVLWLARHGYIEPRELELIETESAAAEARIGKVGEVRTDRERATFHQRVIESLERRAKK